MNSAENPLVVKTSTEADGPELFEFLRRNSKLTPNVFARTEALVHAQAAAGRITTVREKLNPRIRAMSSVYIMGEQSPGNPTPPPIIKCIDHGNGNVESGSVAELGSVIKDLEDSDLPKGFGRLVCFGVPVFMGLLFPTQFDIFVTEIFHSNPETKIFVQDGRVVMNKDQAEEPIRYEEGSPIHCDHIARIHNDLLIACGATSEDPKATLAGRDFYRIGVKNVVPLAKTFRRILEKGYLEDIRSPNHIKFDPDMRVHIDLSELDFWGVPLEKLIKFILNPLNKEHYEKSDRYGTWAAEARYTSLRCKPERKITSVNGMPIGAISTTQQPTFTLAAK